MSPTTVKRLVTLPSLSNFGIVVIARSTFNVLVSKFTLRHFKASASPIRSPPNIKQTQSGLIKLPSSFASASKNLTLTSGVSALYFSLLLTLSCALTFTLLTGFCVTHLLSMAYSKNCDIRCLIFFIVFTL